MLVQNSMFFFSKALLNHTCSSLSGSQYKQGVVLVFLNKLSSRFPAFFCSSSSSSSATSA